MTEIASLVLYAEDPDRTAAFYRALGVPLAAESHDRGLSHLAADVAGVHVAVYPADRPGQAPGRRDGGSTFPGFYVDSLDGAVAALAELGARLLGEHEQMPWGCRVIATDPDGRAVEVNDRAHCGASA